MMYRFINCVGFGSYILRPFVFIPCWLLAMVGYGEFLAWTVVKKILQISRIVLCFHCFDSCVFIPSGWHFTLPKHWCLLLSTFQFCFLTYDCSSSPRESMKGKWQMKKPSNCRVSKQVSYHQLIFFSYSINKCQEHFYWHVGWTIL